MSDLPARVVIVDDDRSICRTLEIHLTKHGCSVTQFTDPLEAVNAIRALGPDPADVILTDLVMPKMTGIELLRTLRDFGIRTPVLVVTAHGSVGAAIEAMKHGAFDFVSKPFDLDCVRAAIFRAVSHYRLLSENEELKQELKAKYRFDNIVGTSRAMQDVFRLVERAASSQANVLIRGESGTGKELVAKALHFNSPRANRRFVPVSCPVFSKDLLESELFGHEKGAFTGALYQKPGRFEVADGGTLFLDEIGDIALDTQVKLLRVLQEREFERVGGTKAIKVDVRLVCATNKDLEHAVRKGDFREDLYYRINVIQICLPALRDRRDDIPLLVEHFVHRYCSQNGREPMGVDRTAMDMLVEYDWPGNVRELENAIEHAVVMSDPETRVLTPALLPDYLRLGRPLGFRSSPQSCLPVQAQHTRITRTFDEVIAHTERELLLDALSQTNWNLTRAAQLLGMSFRSIRYQVKKHGLTRNAADTARSGGQPPSEEERS